jgi:3-deoxy-D-manno-octulosonate 8-phosphate phosphatase (KDO 8-P phosphatase)
MKTFTDMAKSKLIAVLLLDVDGVLTDGQIIYDDDGHETKNFNVRDGLGLRLLMGAGIQIGVVTGRKSQALRHRCSDLGIQWVYDAVTDKAAIIDRILADTGVLAENLAFIGDDLPDIPLMKRVGMAIAVADAHELVQRHADWITTAPGGCGAVREVCEALLNARGLWEEIAGRFL